MIHLEESKLLVINLANEILFLDDDVESKYHEILKSSVRSYRNAILSEDILELVNNRIEVFENLGYSEKEVDEYGEELFLFAKDIILKSMKIDTPFDLNS